MDDKIIESKLVPHIKHGCFSHRCETADAIFTFKEVKLPLSNNNQKLYSVIILRCIYAYGEIR